MTDHVAEQEMEIEALQAILMEEISGRHGASANCIWVIFDLYTRDSDLYLSIERYKHDIPFITLLLTLDITPS